MARRKSWRAIKRHRSYNVYEASRTLGRSKGTIRRWIKDGLPALEDERPMLIMGQDLIDFLKQNSKPAQKCAPHECYCFKCKAPRAPAFDALEYWPSGPNNGQLRALCAVCTTIMHKAASQAVLRRIGSQYAVAVQRADARLNNSAAHPLNDHLEEDG